MVNIWNYGIISIHQQNDQVGKICNFMPVSVFIN